MKIFIRYFIFLILEIVKANFIVACIVLNPKLPISPGLIALKISLQRDLPRVTYANSITLTPGTITVDLDGDRLLVHGMTKDHVSGVRSWYMYDIMKELEEEEMIEKSLQIICIAFVLGLAALFAFKAFRYRLVP